PTLAGLVAWHHQLRLVLDTVADGTQAFGVTGDPLGVSDVIEGGPIGDAGDVMARVDKLVRQANELAERLHAADPRLAEVVYPLLGIPGAPPEVDLRPWWRRVLDKISGHQARAVEQLETLRLEADAALIRAAGRLAPRT